MSSIQNPSEWYQSHWQELRAYVGEWVAYSKDGVISHDRDYLMMIGQVKLDPLEYIIERINENEFIEPIKFYPVRFRTVKASNWQPKYLVTLSYQAARQLKILVDSGADFCLMPKQHQDLNPPHFDSAFCKFSGALIKESDLEIGHPNMMLSIEPLALNLTSIGSEPLSKTAT
jgi:Family of unknown function (DUF5678)